MDAAAPIRRAVAAEAGAVRAIVDDAYAPWVPLIGRQPAPMLDDYDRRIADGQTWVLEVGGRLVGVLVLVAEEGGLLLDNVAVSPAAQGAGHGRALIAFAERQAHAARCARLRLYTHVLMTGNQALYRRLGFAETRRVHEDGFDRVYMEKQLPSEAIAAPPS